MEIPYRGDPPPASIRVERWPTEIPLLVLVCLAALAMWILLVISIFGIIYAVLIGALLFFAHLAFVTHIRGSAVRLGEGQFPDLHRRVRELAAAAGVDPVPDAYIMQAGGTLNALATKLFRSKIIVLYSDLLDACGDNKAARDMIIGHELGHIKAGHLQWMWLLAPGYLMPLLGAAYSRARERTCDRYGAALCGDRSGALLGLAILAAGGPRGPAVNLKALVGQRRDLDTGWMTLGTWFSGYPPLCERVAALQPELADGIPAATNGPLRAILLLVAIMAIPALAMTGFVAILLPKFKEGMEQAALEQPRPRVEDIGAERARAEVTRDFSALAEVADDFRQRSGFFPANDEMLYAAWQALRFGQPEPRDPFDTLRYGYFVRGEGFVLVSSGPDGEPDTDDDITVDESGPKAE